MDTFSALAEQAAAHLQAGNLSAAELAYRQMLVHSPSDPSVLADLSRVLIGSGKLDEAAQQLSTAIQANPRIAALHSGLGTVLRQLGRTPDAIVEYQTALALDPTDAQTHYNLGNALLRGRQFADAATAYERSLALSPADTDALLNLGVVRKELGDLAAAQAALERCLRLKPQTAEAHINLGLIARQQQNTDAALHHYRSALSIDPNSALAHTHLGSLLQGQGDWLAAADEFALAVQAAPNYATAHAKLAGACEELGRVRSAIQHFDTALRLAPTDALKIKASLCLPVIVESEQEITATRARLVSAFDRLSCEHLHIANPVDDVGVPLFYLAYQGENERELQTSYAALMARATPFLNYVAPHAGGQARDNSARITVGFLSQNFRAHTIGKLNAGIVHQLDRSQFEVVVFQFPGHDDPMAQFIAQGADRVVTMPWNLSDAQQVIASEELDILYFTDIGMDPLTYYLAHARLAPVQCVTWGHPLTTGIPTVDYFVSSEELETPESDGCYSEQLVRLPHLTNYYYRPDPHPGDRTRADFGFGDACHLYTCPQSLFKLHPDNDSLFREILRRDPLAKIVLIEGKHATWRELIQARFRRNMGELTERIHFVPRQTLVDFQQLLALSDVLLDPLHFGGGDTSYEGFAVGTPIVTYPGRFLRSRITYALYRAMEITECIAENADDYVARAVRLASDPAHRGQVRDKILAAGSAIYENTAAVCELEQFFLSVASR